MKKRRLHRTKRQWDWGGSNNPSKGNFSPMARERAHVTRVSDRRPTIRRTRRHSPENRTDLRENRIIAMKKRRLNRTKRQWDWGSSNNPWKGNFSPMQKSRPLESIASNSSRLSPMQASRLLESIASNSSSLTIRRTRRHSPENRTDLRENRIMAMKKRRLNRTKRQWDWGSSNNPWKGNFSPTSSRPHESIASIQRRLNRTKRQSDWGGSNNPSEGNFSPMGVGEDPARPAVVVRPEIRIEKRIEAQLLNRTKRGWNSTDRNDPWQGNYDLLSVGSKPGNRSRRHTLNRTKRHSNGGDGVPSPFNGNFNPIFQVSVPEYTMGTDGRAILVDRRRSRTKRHSNGGDGAPSPFNGNFNPVFQVSVPEYIMGPDGRAILVDRRRSRTKRHSNGGDSRTVQTRTKRQWDNVNDPSDGNYSPMAREELALNRSRRHTWGEGNQPGSMQSDEAGVERPRVGLGGTLTWQERERLGQDGGASGYVHTSGGKHVANGPSSRRQIRVASGYTSGGSDPLGGRNDRNPDSPDPVVDPSSGEEGVYFHTMNGRHIASNGKKGRRHRNRRPVPSGEVPNYDSVTSGNGADSTAPVEEPGSESSPSGAGYVHTIRGRHRARKVKPRRNQDSPTGGHARRGSDDNPDPRLRERTDQPESPEPHGTYVHTRNGNHLALGLNGPRSDDRNDDANFRTYPANFFSQRTRNSQQVPNNNPGLPGNEFSARNTDTSRYRVNRRSNGYVNYNSGYPTHDGANNYRGLTRGRRPNTPYRQQYGVSYHADPHGSPDRLLVANMGPSQLRASLIHVRDRNQRGQNQRWQYEAPSPVGSESESVYHPSYGYVPRGRFPVEDDWRRSGLSVLERSLGGTQYGVPAYGYDAPSPCSRQTFPRRTSRPRTTGCYRNGVRIPCADCDDVTTDVTATDPRSYTSPNLDTSRNPGNPCPGSAGCQEAVASPCSGCNAPVYFSTRGCQTRNGPETWDGEGGQWRQPIGPLMPSSFCDEFRSCCMNGGQGQGQGRPDGVPRGEQIPQGPDGGDYNPVLGTSNPRVQPNERDPGSDVTESETPSKRRSLIDRPETEAPSRLDKALTSDRLPEVDIGDAAANQEAEGERTSDHVTVDVTTADNQKTGLQGGKTIAQCPRGQTLIKDGRGWRCQQQDGVQQGKYPSRKRLGQQREGNRGRTDESRRYAQLREESLRRIRERMRDEDGKDSGRDRTDSDIGRRSSDASQSTASSQPARSVAPSNAASSRHSPPSSGSDCSTKCMNGGRCVRGMCLCPNSFTGEFCQTDVNECLWPSHGCQFACRNTYGSFVCTCPEGAQIAMDGKTCEARPCSLKCRNGGTCANGKCRCAAGFYGTLCQKDKNECLRSTPCSHQCLNTVGSFTCVCPLGYSLTDDQRTCIPKQ